MCDALPSSILMSSSQALEGPFDESIAFTTQGCCGYDAPADKEEEPGHLRWLEPLLQGLRQVAERIQIREQDRQDQR
jgi:hypothetical protein